MSTTYDIEPTAGELPEVYVRVNVTQNSKGINVDKTISVKGHIPTHQLATLLEEVSLVAEEQERAERRKLTEGTAK